LVGFDSLGDALAELVAFAFDFDALADLFGNFGEFDAFEFDALADLFGDFGEFDFFGASLSGEGAFDALADFFRASLSGEDAFEFDALGELLGEGASELGVIGVIFGAETALPPRSTLLKNSFHDRN
tara:strand:- start:6255 stop:6635 length:381 start_codon:yes stop_codon:yes gene_type:complete